MFFRDRFLTCRSCGIRFLFSAAQQRQQAENSSPRTPDCCPGCRALNAWWEQQASERHRGTVRWYDARKGYGFIRDNEGQEVFVHRSALHRGRLRSGQQVEYTITQTERGLAAEEVARVSE